MTSSRKDTAPKTTIWKSTAGGTTLVKTLRGLPYGTARTAFIEGLGEANLSGTQKSGSGNNETIVEVMYTLK